MDCFFHKETVDFFDGYPREGGGEGKKKDAPYRRVTTTRQVKEVVKKFFPRRPFRLTGRCWKEIYPTVAAGTTCHPEKFAYRFYTGRLCICTVPAPLEFFQGSLQMRLDLFDQRFQRGGRLHGSQRINGHDHSALFVFPAEDPVVGEQGPDVDLPGTHGWPVARALLTAL